MVDEGLNSLASFRGQIHFRGKPGQSGTGSGRHGAQGVDVEIPVPKGTVIRCRDAGEGQPPLAELLEPGTLSGSHTSYLLLNTVQLSRTTRFRSPHSNDKSRKA